jgi:hypothetical protein
MEKDEGGLEEIVNGINNSDLSLSGKIKRMTYVPLAVAYAGLLKQEYQKAFARKIGWKEKNLTISNATFFGLGSSVLFYFLGEGASSLGNSGYIQDLNNAAVSWTANLFGTTSKTILHAHAYFDGIQSLFRIGYSYLTEKAIASFSLSGAIGNIAQYTLISLKKKFPENNQQKRN